MAGKLDFLVLTDPDDIAINRQGRVSPNQQEVYAAQPKPSVVSNFLTLFVVAAAIAYLIVFAIATLTDFLPFQNNSNIVIVIAIVAGIIRSFLSAFFSMQTRARITGKMSEGKVEPVDGEVTWTGNRYKAQSEGGKLVPVSGKTITLPPGRYRFYVLAETNYLLTAESLDLKATTASSILDGFKSESPDLLSILAKAHRFEIASLEYNQTGRLSPSQRGQFLIQAALNLLGAILSIGMVLLLGQYLFGESITNLFILFAIAGFILLIFGVVQIVHLMTLWKSEVKSVESVLGKDVVITHRHKGSTYFNYFYTAENNLRWNVTEAAYNALIEGIRYRVYYTSRRNILLAIEPLPAKKE